MTAKSCLVRYLGTSTYCRIARGKKAVAGILGMSCQKQWGHVLKYMVERQTPEASTFLTVSRKR